MSAVPTTSPLQARRRLARDRLGDLALHGLTLAAALACRRFSSARSSGRSSQLAQRLRSTASGSASSRHATWDPVKHVFGALPFIYGTAVTSLIALVIATPLAIAIGALPERARAARRARRHRVARRDARRDPERRARALGDPRARPVPRRTTSSRGCTARSASSRSSASPQRPGRDCSPPALILTIMIVPIVASHLPRALPGRAERARGGRARARRDALGDGARRDPARDAVGDRRGDHPRARSRARRGDRRHAGDRRRHAESRWSLFAPATRSRARSPPATRAQAPASRPSSLLYLAAILLVIGLIANLIAQVIVRRFDPLRERAERGPELADQARRRRIVNRIMESRRHPRGARSPSRCSASWSCRSRERGAGASAGTSSRSRRRSSASRAAASRTRSSAPRCSS